MIDNIALIKPLLKFESDDDYYFLQVLLRKKDRELLPFKVGGSNNNSRLIKSYNVTSVEYLENRYEEIKVMCNLFKARAMICLNKRSFYSSSHQMMVQLAQSIQNQNYKNARMWNNVSGKYNPIKDKTWLLDIDNKMEAIDIQVLRDALHQVEPFGDKILGIIPSKAGLHLITKPFNVMKADKIIKNYDIDIHKNNPTNLYIP